MQTATQIQEYLCPLSTDIARIHLGVGPAGRWLSKAAILNTCNEESHHLIKLKLGAAIGLRGCLTDICKLNLKLGRNLIKMADKARPCPCIDPKLPQFNWVSTLDPIGGRGKRLLLCTTFILFLL